MKLGSSSKSRSKFFDNFRLIKELNSISKQQQDLRKKNISYAAICEKQDYKIKGKTSVKS